MKSRLTPFLLFFTLLVCSILYSSQSSWAEDRVLLLFARDQTFLPYIVDILGDLPNHKTGKPYFSEIINLNKWSINRLELTDLDELMRFYESSPELRKKRKATQPYLLAPELIRKADTYIRIDVRHMLPLVEFEVIITDSLPQVDKGEFPVIVTSNSRYEGFVIDISREDYHYKLENSLKRLFPVSNRAPIPVVKVNKEVDEDGYYYFGVGQEVVLDGAESYDFDTPFELLQFRWAQKNPAGTMWPLPEDEIMWIDVSSKKQVLTFDKKGEYHFSLTISDGIVDSEARVVKVKVTDSPKLSAKSHVSIISDGFASDRKFRVPFKIFQDSGRVINSRVLTASVEERPPWLDRLIGVSVPTRTLDINEYGIHLMDSASSSGIETKYYDLVVREGDPPDDYKYQFRVVAEDDRHVADTLDLSIDFRNRDIAMRAKFANFFFRGRKDSFDVEKRVIAFLNSVNAYVYKEFWFEIGNVYSLYEDDVEDTLDMFDTPDVYLSLNWGIFSVPAYFSTEGQSGVGVGVDLSGVSQTLPISLQLVIFPDYQSTCAAGSFEISGGWAAVGFGLLFLAALF